MWKSPQRVFRAQDQYCLILCPHSLWIKMYSFWISQMSASWWHFISLKKNHWRPYGVASDQLWGLLIVHLSKLWGKAFVQSFSLWRLHVTDSKNYGKFTLFCKEVKMWPSEINMGTWFTSRVDSYFLLSGCFCRIMYNYNILEMVIRIGQLVQSNGKAIHPEWPPCSSLQDY